MGCLSKRQKAVNLMMPSTRLSIHNLRRGIDVDNGTAT